MSILRNLYEGNIFPAEDIVPEDPEYRIITDKIDKERQYFERKLSDDDKERFEKWNGLVYECEKMTAYANFACGFKMGAAIVYETVDKGSEE